MKSAGRYEFYSMFSVHKIFKIIPTTYILFVGSIILLDYENASFK